MVSLKLIVYIISSSIYLKSYDNFLKNIDTVISYPINAFN